MQKQFFKPFQCICILQKFASTRCTVHLASSYRTMALLTWSGVATRTYFLKSETHNSATFLKLSTCYSKVVSPIRVYNSYINNVFSTFVYNTLKGVGRYISKLLLKLAS